MMTLGYQRVDLFFIKYIMQLLMRSSQQNINNNTILQVFLSDMFQDQVRNFVTSLELIFLLKCTFFNLLYQYVVSFFNYLIFVIFSYRDCSNFIIIFFLFGRQIVFAVVAPVVSFFLKMVNFYFNILKLIVILILVFNHPCLHNICLLLIHYQMTSDTHPCLSRIFAQCNQIP